MAVQPLDLPGPEVREPELAAGEREHDLARVQVSGEDEVERPGRDAPHDAREVAEEDAEVGLGVGEPLRVGDAPCVGAGLDADELHAPARDLDVDRLVAEQRHVLELLEHGGVDPLGEGIAAVREVVVAEDDEAAPELSQQLAEERQPRRRETRSPVMQTSSGFRDATHATASALARSPRDGTPRWKSARCAMRSPSSSGGSPGPRPRARASGATPPRTPPGHRR